jgi:hypothetical protein
MCPASELADEKEDRIHEEWCEDRKVSGSLRLSARTQLSRHERELVAKDA